MQRATPVTSFKDLLIKDMSLTIHHQNNLSLITEIHKQDISQEGKNICIFHELGNKMQLGVRVHCQSLNRFSGGPGGKDIICTVMFVFGSSQVKNEAKVNSVQQER